MVIVCMFFLFFKQKTAYEMRISDWSSDVCSSDLSIVEHLIDHTECGGLFALHGIWIEADNPFHLACRTQRPCERSTDQAEANDREMSNAHGDFSTVLSACTKRSFSACVPTVTRRNCGRSYEASGRTITPCSSKP